MASPSPMANSASAPGSAAPSDISPVLVPVVTFLSALLTSLTNLFHRLPGSPILLRYIKSSYQDDPYRSLLEVLLVAFALRTLLARRTRGEGEGKGLRLSEKEIDELIDDWQPVPLVQTLSDLEKQTLESVPVVYGQNGAHARLAPGGKQLINLALYDWLGFVENDSIKDVAIKTLHEYGVGSCGPMGFYGTIDVHTKFEQDVADFLDVESAIIYAQGFSAVSSAIPAFAKRGDIIVADRGVNFAIHKGLQLSRCTIRWYAHGDMNDLERVLSSVDREIRRKGSKLTRRFIVTEGIFENDGMMSDLPKICELKKKYKYRLILDESMSFGMIGAHGRGLTEHFGIPAEEVEILIGSMANALGAGGGFCAGSQHVTAHQRINSGASVFSAAIPAMHATVSSAAVKMMEDQPYLTTNLRANVLTFRQQLVKLEPFTANPPSPNASRESPNKDALISIPSHPESGLIHIFLVNPPPTLEEEENMLQDVVDECIANGVVITRARRLRGQEAVEPEPSLKVCISAVLNRKEVEKAGKTLRDALVKVCSKRR